MSLYFLPDVGNTNESYEKGIYLHMRARAVIGLHDKGFKSC